MNLYQEVAQEQDELAFKQALEKNIRVIKGHIAGKYRQAFSIYDGPDQDRMIAALRDRGIQVKHSAFTSGLMVQLSF